MTRRKCLSGPHFRMQEDTENSIHCLTCDDQFSFLRNRVRPMLDVFEFNVQIETGGHIEIGSSIRLPRNSFRQSSVVYIWANGVHSCMIQLSQ